MFNPFKKKPFKIDDFAKLVMAEAKKAGLAESQEYDQKSFCLIGGGSVLTWAISSTTILRPPVNIRNGFWETLWPSSVRRSGTSRLKRPNPRWWSPFESRLSSPSRPFGRNWKAARPDRRSRLNPLHTPSSMTQMSRLVQLTRFPRSGPPLPRP